MEELMSFPFTPNEAFIVSRINGLWDVRSIARISPFPEAEVFRLLAKLEAGGVVAFK
jgi:DNA-binding IclR family transcriptional regulator